MQPIGTIFVGGNPRIIPVKIHQIVSSEYDKPIDLSTARPK